MTNDYYIHGEDGDFGIPLLTISRWLTHWRRRYLARISLAIKELKAY